MRRVLEPEWMDDPDLDPDLHDAALRGLARINAVSGTASALWPAVAEAALAVGASPDRPLRLLDVACGGGDVMAALRRRADRVGLCLDCVGVDLSPRADGGAARCVDVTRDDLPGGFDAALSTLFLHHLDEPTAAAVLRRMAAAAPRVWISDLRRGRGAWLTAWLGTRCLSRSPVVHRDGPQSVAAGWTAAELAELADAAGLAGARIRRRPPGRLELRWEGMA